MFSSIRSRKSNHSGFTLIELLVVVAIIAVLIGILLPALGKARLSAQTVKSKANLRSIGQIQFLYAGDHRDSYINPFNTNKTGGGAQQGGWSTVTKPGLGASPYRWEFTTAGAPMKWYSEMYAFHWYSLTGSWVNDGDYGSEVQFAPADKIIISRFADLLNEEDGFNLGTGIWDTSYILSPTVWFDPERYAEDERPTTFRSNGPRSMARRNKVSETAFPSSKVIVWERFDFAKDTRRSTQDIGFTVVDFGVETGHPQWNNNDAEPAALTADGSVVTASIPDIRSRSEDEDPLVSQAYTPTDRWDPPTQLLLQYGMAYDGFELGSNVAGFGGGLYPAFFWATRDGIKGRDLVR
ncbi:MAG: type II secretion system protein [Phycisphaerales bacterium]|nr:type II secretion system protein [Phycisphaerales bacterium]